MVLHLFAALGCIVGATLIARPPFLFGEVEQDKNVEIDQMAYPQPVSERFSVDACSY